MLVIQDLFRGCCVHASMHRCTHVCRHAGQASSVSVPGVAGSQERLEVPGARRGLQVFCSMVHSIRLIPGIESEELPGVQLFRTYSGLWVDQP